MSTGAGFPAPKCFDGALINGMNLDLLIVPPLDKQVIIYGAWSDSTTSGALTSFQILTDGTVLWISEAHAGAGIPDALSTIGTLLTLPRGRPVTVRLKDCTGGNLIAAAAFQH